MYCKYCNCDVKPKNWESHINKKFHKGKVFKQKTKTEKEKPVDIIWNEILKSVECESIDSWQEDIIAGYYKDTKNVKLSDSIADMKKYINEVKYMMTDEEFLTYSGEFEDPMPEGMTDEEFLTYSGEFDEEPN